MDDLIYDESGFPVGAAGPLKYPQPPPGGFFVSPTMFNLSSASRAKLAGVHPDLVRGVERAAEREPMDQPTARALVEAGYMTVADYLALCAAHGWPAQPKE